MSLHDGFGRHVADPETSHRESGYLAGRCTRCGRDMVSLPGLPWRLREAGPA